MKKRTQLWSFPFRLSKLQGRFRRVSARGLKAHKFDKGVAIGALDFGDAAPHASEHRGALGLNFVSLGHWWADPLLLTVAAGTGDSGAEGL
jgi:hypothetical protein